MHLSVASGLDGVTNVAVVVDPVVRGGTPRRKVMPSLLLRLGAPGLWLVRAIVGGVTAAFSCWWGMSIGAVPVGGGHRLERLRECGTASGD